MTGKAFKTVDEQITLLRSRGLNISDEELAREFLLHNNYYRVSGYSLTLRTHDKFNKNARFENIVEIYNFDHLLRHILLKYIEKIEVTVKSVYTYEFAKKHGPFGYLNPDFFTDTEKYNNIIAKSDKQKNLRLPHEAYLKHFVNELQESIPLWAYVDLLTISDISILYSISEPDIQVAVAAKLGIAHQGAQLLSHFMHKMTIVRNLSAHGSRLYNRLFEQRPRLSAQDREMLIRDENGNVDNAHLFGFILIMRKLLSPEDFSSMIDEISANTKKYPFVAMRYYGFCDNWEILLK